MKKSFVNIFFPGILIISVAFVFYPSIHCELTNWEVDEYILKNPYIQSLSADNIIRMFSDIYYINYQPLTHLSFALENYFFGINPAVMHGINVLLHIANTLLVYFLFRLLTGGNFPAFLTAALFSIHPLRVESVTWVVERKDVQYAFFYLLSLISWHKYIATDKKSSSYFYYGAALFCFILSCLTKGMGVSLFLVLLLFDFLLKRKFTTTLLVEKIPFFLIGVAFGVIALYATHEYGSVEPYKEYLVSSYNQYSLVERFLLTSYAVIFYFIKFFLPFNLSVFYPYIIKTDILPLSYWIFPLLICLFMYPVILSLKYTRKVIFSIGFFLATIIFILPFHPVNISIVFERYTYLAHCGIAFLVITTVMYLIKINEQYGFFNTSHVKIYLYGILLIWFCYSGAATRQRISVWQNSNTLWRDYIKKFPGHFLGYLNYGTLLAVDGKLEEAIKNFSVAITFNPFDYRAYLDRGNAYALTKQYYNAVADYSMVLELNTNKPEIYYNRGIARLFLKDTLGACEDWKMALQMGYGATETKVRKYCNSPPLLK